MTSRGYGRITGAMLAVLGVVLTWLAVSRISAADGQDLYQAAVPVQDQGAEARNAAVAAALDTVMVRLTGSRGVVKQPAARALRRDAARLVQQYHYELAAAPKTGGAGQGRILVARFDPTALRQALEDQGLPAWTGTRPSLLLWLTVAGPGSGGPRFFPGEGDQGLKAALLEVAARRGISVLLPLLDLEDLRGLQPRDLAQADATRLRQASRRYPADLVLAARLRETTNGARVDWQLLYPQGSEAWQSRGKTAPEALTAGLEEGFDRVAAAYAPSAGGVAASLVRVQVRGVQDLDSYLRVDRFLRGLDGVELVLPVRVEPEQVLWRVRVRGGAEALDRSAALGHLLTAEPAPIVPPPGAASPASLPTARAQGQDETGPVAAPQAAPPPAPAPAPQGGPAAVADLYYRLGP
jgi:hypothetical protein